MTVSALAALTDPVAVNAGGAVAQEAVLAAGWTAADTVTPPALPLPHSSLYAASFEVRATGLITLISPQPLPAALVLTVSPVT